MNLLKTLTTIFLGITICLVSVSLAGGDKSAKTTVITLTGGGEKQGGGGYPVPIPIPYCSGGGGRPQFGANSRMGWIR